MRAFYLLPSWLYYRSFRRWLPDTHPWKHPIPFDSWVQGNTDAGVWVSAALGYVALLFVGVIAKIAWGRW